MPSEQLADAIRSAAKGQSPIGPEMARKLVNLVTQNPIVPLPPTATDLSEREIEVLRLIAAGLSNKEIGEKLFIAEGTAKNHVSNILSKLEARDRAQAVARAKELGLV
jgi:DNA-binding NarL/FixJ family response regulator